MRRRDYAVIALHDYAPGDAAFFRSLGAFMTYADARKHYYRSPESPDVLLDLADTCLSGFEGDRFL